MRDRMANRFFLSSTHTAAGVVTGSALKYCPSNADGVCYSVGVPSSSAAAGSGNIYFQITAPTSYQWVALGPGTSMSNSYMFIVYEDGGGNMTVSPRKGTPHSTPQLDTSGSAAKLTLLAGSGVSADGKTMTANVQCANCDSLPGGGKLTLADTKSGWIAAWKSGPSFATTSTSQRINIHDDTTEFQLDLTKATLGSDSNPFWHDEASSGGGGSGSDTGSGSGSDSGSGSGSGSGSDSGSGSGSGSGTGSDDSGSDTGSSGGNADSDGGSDSGGGVTVIPDRKSDNIAILIVTHGIIMAVVMVALYPIGSLMMPVLGKWAAHATFQMVSFTLMWIGFGIGVKSAMATDIVRILSPHPPWHSAKRSPLAR